ncbi:MAG: SAM-dependent chlorinase/fluorinase [Okeania sp. SIO2F4]|uniref:SAM hydrolase/SAM-dependent halogenase family protein n=1 Tax=Okeania sp. SIO2F4 TaxID=2607790 RepID=UPI00142A85A9|nr:SAM-dependent chlorinase/fluorinase [Okeania sp. SIO2F4]NES06216.1 SAM-dependent chlorinase/fluorinase [Okeania sp. SIO2F4]
MSDQKIITLLTDFGLKDVYVGVMKGVIYQINSNLKVIDLTHEIPPQNLFAARFCLQNAYRYFPPETVHVAVVDPGVGSTRRAIALQLPNGFLVGPDNGIFSGVLENLEIQNIKVVTLTNSEYWRTKTPSTTFHGRDIFTPVAAHIASGVKLENLGDKINPDSLVKLPLNNITLTESGIVGCVQHIDHFGNIITNISSSYVVEKNWSVIVNNNADFLQNKKISSGNTYADCKAGELIAIIGSHGFVEIAANGSSAEEQLNLKYGDRVEIVWF